MTDEARAAQRKYKREYMREWRAKNRDKVSANNEAYWERKGKQMAISPNEYEQKVRGEIELDSAYAVIHIPTSAVEVTLSAKVYVDGKIRTVQQFLDMKAIRDAIKEAEDNYIPEDAMFTLTEKGTAEAERITNGQD